MHAKRQTNLMRKSRPKEPSRWRSGFFLNVCLVAAAVIILTVILLVEDEEAFGTRNSSDQGSKSTGRVESVYGFLELSQKDLAACDIALMNLLCAKGLPGADGLDVERALQTLDDWSKHVKHEIDRNAYRFRQNPGEYNNSWARFAMGMLTTVLQQDFGVRYNPERANDPDFTDSRDLFIHGLIGEKRTGTCLSMPVFYIAVGRRLGYPLKLAQNKMHLYVKWEDASEKLNIEATSQGLVCKDDAYYANWPEPLTRTQFESGMYLRGLTPAEELSVFLTARGHCLQDTGRLPDAQAAYALAHVQAPNMPYSLHFLASAVRSENPLLIDSFSRPARVRRASNPTNPLRWVDELNEHHRRLLEAGRPPSGQPHQTPGVTSSTAFPF